jgi:hypothetical protein
LGSTLTSSIASRIVISPAPSLGFMTGPLENERDPEPEDMLEFVIGEATKEGFSWTGVQENEDESEGEDILGGEDNSGGEEESEDWDWDGSYHGGDDGEEDGTSEGEEDGGDDSEEDGTSEREEESREENKSEVKDEPEEEDIALQDHEVYYCEAPLE